MNVITQQKQAETLSSMPLPGNRLQRKCACGQHTVAGGECAECRKKRLQRKSAERSMPESVPSIVHEVLHAPGRPLNGDIRSFMEERFGHDFSRVRVHTDAKAAESAGAVNALAYSVGRDVVFGKAQFSPGTQVGKRLIAHELTHVMQQSDSKISDTNLALGKVNSQHEREAESVAARLDETRMSAGTTDNVNGLTVAQPNVLHRLTAGQAVAGGAVAGLVLGAVTFAAALAYARSLSTRYPGWLSVLPDCPCAETEARSNTATWEPDANPILGYFHPGAASSYRSKTTYSSIPGTAHGQQCTYDSSGSLITEGPGAGTPDVWSPNASTGNHFLHDVTTWQVLGWRIYNRYWRPNNGNSCSANRGDNTIGRSISEFLP